MIYFEMISTSRTSLKAPELAIFCVEASRAWLDLKKLILAVPLVRLRSIFAFNGENHLNMLRLRRWFFDGATGNHPTQGLYLYNIILLFGRAALKWAYENHQISPPQLRGQFLWPNSFGLVYAQCLLRISSGL